MTLRTPRARAASATTLLAGTAGGLMLAAAGAASAQEAVGTGTAAVLLSENTEIRQADLAETLVELSFVIGTDGSVGDVLVLDAYGPRSRRQAIVERIQERAYEPATWLGVPVEQAADREHLWLDVSGVGNEGVGRRFADSYREIMTALRAGELDSAARRIERLDRGNQSLLRMVYLSLLRAELANRRQRPAEAAFYLRRASSPAERYLEPREYYRVLRSRLTAQLAAEMFGEAIGSYAELREHPLYVPDEAIGAAFDRVQDLYLRPEPVARAAEIPDWEGREAPLWDRLLLRQQFALANVEGVLERLEVRCERNHGVSTIAPNRIWQLEAHWGACWLYVFGEPGTRFELIELAE